MVAGALNGTVGGHNYDTYQGAAYVFNEPATGWGDMTQTVELVASDGEGGDHLGGSASISGDTVVTGALYARAGANAGQGAAYVFGDSPAVGSISPSSGPAAGGTTVTITGTNLGAVGAATVLFGTTAATIVSDTGTQIVATSPAGTVGTVDVTVATAGGTSATTAADQFTYVAAPTVTKISPVAGSVSGGTSVTITGANLAGATAVMFGKIDAASFNISPAGQIVATSPAGTAAGSVDVTVVTAGGTSKVSAADKFTYVAIPAVAKLTPAAGPMAGGTLVTITGTGLAGGSVFFGKQQAKLKSVTATRIVAISPAGAAGTVAVTVTTTGGTSALVAADRFTYAAGPTQRQPPTDRGLLALVLEFPELAGIIRARNTSPKRKRGSGGKLPSLTLRAGVACSALWLPGP